MSIVNRRNAVLGWATWQVTKHVARKKARQAARRGRPAEQADGRSRGGGRAGGLGALLAQGAQAHRGR